MEITVRRMAFVSPRGIEALVGIRTDTPPRNYAEVTVTIEGVDDQALSELKTEAIKRAIEFLAHVVATSAVDDLMDVSNDEPTE